jgi:hypothetical protein
LSSKCIDRFPFGAQCICDNMYVGNGKTECEKCGVIIARPNVLRIVGGMEAVESSWPFIVYIVQSYKRQFRYNGDIYDINVKWTCGGTIINQRTILTASHCVHDTSWYHYDRETNQDILINIEWNEYYPDLESTFNVYIGAHDTRNIYEAKKVKVKKVIKVI